MQNMSILQAQIESLKEIIEVMEATMPDTLVKKWRGKVFEELVRNKQQQIMHFVEIKKFKDEEKKLKSKEQQIRAALESAHMQASSLNLERVKLQKEIQTLQGKLRNTSINSSYLMNLQSVMTSNLELHARVLGMLDTFNHRITFSMSKIKTAKILHTREIFGLRNKLLEETSEQKKLKEEYNKNKTLSIEKENLSQDVLRLSQEIENINHKFKVAETKANSILLETTEKYIDCIKDLEAQITEKNDQVQSISELLSKADEELLQTQKKFLSLGQDYEKAIEENQKLKNNLSEALQNNEYLTATLNEKSILHQNNLEQMESLSQKIEEIELIKRNEINQLLRKIQAQEIEIQNHENTINQITTANNEILEDYNQTTETLKIKVNKLESQVKEFKRERDILIENLKKSNNKSKEDKETQTDTNMKYTAMKKTLAPVHSRLDELEALSKEILDT
jgi:chromosome segregation ATPase